MVAAQGQQKRSTDTHTHTMTLTSLDLLVALHVTTGRPRQQSTYTNGNYDSQSYLARENTSALKQPKLN